ncbi:DNA polymerase III subunit delta [Mesomycoplasma hyorhinis]|uniref:DNA polymerase III subunit delta n=1 Tax=Mesomycoplasma hyorhinis TaxID=2100 RepID=UPI001C03A997|nr:DNA polymerase III subunit delta [Mesomycoplasma hyorhinis]
MFFVYGTDSYFTKKKVEQILAKFIDFEVVDVLSTDSFCDIMNTITTRDLFGSNKLFIFHNFLDTKLTNSEEKKIAKKLIDSSSPVIFLYELEEENQEKKIFSSFFYSHFFKSSSVFKTETLSDKTIIKFISKFIEENQGTIDESQLLTLSLKLPLNGSIIEKELNKLLLYDKNITEESIENLLTKYDSDSDWNFINAFTDHDVASTWNFYKEKINQGKKIQFLISQLSSKLMLAFICFLYKEEKYNEFDIQKELQIHIFQVKKAVQFYKKIGITKLQELIKLLAKIDRKIKSNQVNEKDAFEYFLLMSIK